MKKKQLSRDRSTSQAASQQLRKNKRVPKESKNNNHHAVKATKLIKKEDPLKRRQTKENFNYLNKRREMESDEEMHSVERIVPKWQRYMNPSSMKKSYLSKTSSELMDVDESND